MTGSHERCRCPWTTTCQPLVDFIPKHAGTLEPLHDHGHVLAGVVIVVEALSGFVRVEDCNANHCCLLLHCTIQNCMSRHATNHVRGYEASVPSRALASFRSHVSKPSVNQL